MENLNVETRRGTVLNGVLFPAQKSDTVVVAITGIHGNFYSNPFYYNIGDTLSEHGIDFIYAQTKTLSAKSKPSTRKPARKKLSARGTKDFPTPTKILRLISTAPRKITNTSFWRGIPSERTKLFTISPNTTINSASNTLSCLAPQI